MRVCSYCFQGAGFAPANYDGQLRMFRESGVDLDSDDEDGDGGSDAPLDPNDLQDLQKKYNMLLRVSRGECVMGTNNALGYDAL